MRSMPTATLRGLAPVWPKVSSCSDTFSIRSSFRGSMRISHGRVSTARSQRLTFRLHTRRVRQRLSRAGGLARPHYHQLIVVASDCDESAAAGVVQQLHVAYLTVDRQPTSLRVNRREMPLPASAQH